ncbi:MAG: adenosine deaminase [Legionella sp.]|nr:MAG: adenosine deaminase [Legionella sp.]
MYIKELFSWGFICAIIGLFLLDNPMQRLSLAIWLLLVCVWSPGQASVSEHFKKIQTQPDVLYDFLKDMPKGGELHYHYDGSVYTETMLQLATKSNLCVHTPSLTTQPCTQQATQWRIPTIISQPALRTKLIQDWSMQDFKPLKQSAHDHFFAVFPKVGAFYSELKGQLLAEILKKAGEQHEHYMEIIAFGLRSSGDDFVPLIRTAADLEKKRAILMANPSFKQSVQDIVKDSQTFLPQAHSVLHCNTQPKQAACQIAVNFQFYVRRVKSLDAVFAQALAGFMAAQQSKTIVAINLVDIEDNAVAQHDYNAHMRMFEMLHRLYPDVHIALHAGELYPKTVAPHQVAAPIHEAILIGHAERIGHGLDIQDEPYPDALAALMSEKAIAVEINLSSNRLIFGVKDKQHPLTYYLKHHVPVVLSTDDEGILRTDLTKEYLEAAVQHHLDYATIKHINRNTLTYGFIEGQSLWQDPHNAIPVKECRSLSSLRCEIFIQHNPKANLQWQLEQDLKKFEKKW